ncbi:hypothetical protein J2X46_002821 [Nocardioides sp. BE266]|uniref:NADase-type glycan-binding domain-containing protein n=1 Tax=Nocardioides sp. BE266 TaxID=2817725 RepID=UPI00285939A2|nr:hypothetical protein [Nocardioides sp. BE266]MDR7253831.1 hypothetical protein [Nocardioides sp. BE266]
MDTCVRCGAELGVGRFCLNCGHPIGAPAPAAPKAAVAPAPAAAPTPEATTPTSAQKPTPKPAPEHPTAEAEDVPEVSEAPPAAVPVQAADPVPLPPAPVVPPGREPRFRLRGRPAATAREDAVPAAGTVATATSEWDPERDLLPYHEVDELEPEAPLTGLAWVYWVVGAVALVALIFVLLQVFKSDPVDDTASEQPAGQSSTTPDDGASDPDETTTDGSESPAPEGVGKRFDLADTATFTAPDTAPPTQDFDGNTVAYEASQMGDGNPATTWRMAGDATGQSITISLAEPGVINRVGLINGYAKQVAGVNWYPNNRRILSATWAFDDGTTAEQTFAERPTMQLLKVPPVKASTVTLTITSVTPPGSGPLGRDYTAISEVTLVGRRAA